jgi:FkbM family methyltransferase
MLSAVKNELKKITPLLEFVRLIRRINMPVRLWLADVRSGMLSRSQKMVETPYGFKLMGTNSIHHIAMQKGTFEPEETRLFKKIFETSDIFIDVGANIGFYSCLAKQAGLRVVTIEPLEKNLDYIYQNFLANSWNDIEVLPVGLSDKIGIATIFGGSSTGPSLIANWAGSSQLFQKNIALTTLDRLVDESFQGKQIFIKIDIEGAEYQALLGAQKTMTMSPKPVWVIEICFHEFYPEGHNPYFEKTFQLFWDNGYEIRTANDENKLIIPEDLARWVKNGYADSGSINYKFSPKSY